MFEWASICGPRPAVMGIINVTPDSFSDGGRFAGVEAAVAHGRALAAEGADLLDVGGESTRPGAEPVTAEDEARRVVPVVRRLATEAGVPVSIDTTKASVAEAALAAGATVVNDVSGGRTDPQILGVTADAGAGFVAMHMQGEPRTMQDDPRYHDVVGEVTDFLRERVVVAREAGIRVDAVAVDPGIGFGKALDHNLTLLARLPELVASVGVPVLIGTSRKRFLGALVRDTGGVEGEPAPDARDDATLATTVWAVERGARIVRVHDVRGTVHAVRLLEALTKAAA
jgi:dihydropteroate synthase